MKINTKARYSVRLMCDIETQGGKSPVSLKDIARRQKITKRYLEQLVIPLRKANLIEGVAGKNGGYRLTKSAVNITLLEIIEAAEGPVRVLSCLNGEIECAQYPDCVSRQVWIEINAGIVNVLSSHRLSDLCGANSQQKKKARTKSR